MSLEVEKCNYCGNWVVWSTKEPDCGCRDKDKKQIKSDKPLSLEQRYHLFNLED